METSPNLKTGNTSLKNLLLSKLGYATIFCVTFQIVLIFVYVFIVNFSIRIDSWFQSAINIITSFTTWLYTLPFTFVSLAQTIMYGKGYLIKVSYRSSRFRQYLSVFSLRSLSMIILQMLGGLFAVSLCLFLVEKNGEAFLVECDEKMCFQEGGLFLILNGLWIGLYYFLQIHICKPALVFPVIFQSKFKNFKTQFLNILNESKTFSLYPTIYFITFYNIFRECVCNVVTAFLNVSVERQEFSLLLYVYAWMFSTCYVTNVNFMQFSFKLFLIQPVEHSILKTVNDDDDAILSEALMFDKVPVLQHLACLDFYLLSLWSPRRRQMLYTLSKPGGHPHTWNHMICSVLTLLTNFREPLKKTLERAIYSDNRQKLITEMNLPSEISRSYLDMEDKYPNMRYMIVANSFVESPHIIEVARGTFAFNQMADTVKEALSAKTSELIVYIKNLPCYKYLFDDLSEAQIEECLQDGQKIVWLVLGLANVVVHSLQEDRYGIIQKDLPIILTDLIELKMTIERLNKVLSTSKKGGNDDDSNRKIANNINNATKRSLTNICRTYRENLNDILLEETVRIEFLAYM